MTVYEYPKPFIFEMESPDYHCCCVDMKSEEVVRVDVCLKICYWNFMGGGKWDKYGNYCRKQYMHFNKEDNSDEMADFCPQGYENLLDNFNLYYGVVEDENTVTVLCIGSCLGYTSYQYSLENLSEGFGVVVNKFTNDITLVALGEDDGNYWGCKEIPYENLTKYDRNEVIRIVNDIPSNHFYNKNELIQKLWYS